MNDGPVEKFNLIKQHGAMLRGLGYEPKAMSCSELRSTIAREQSFETEMMRLNPQPRD